MNTMPFLKTWNDVKAELKQQFSQLTDEDLAYEHGQDLVIIRRLQAKLGLSRCEVQDLLAQAF